MTEELIAKKDLLTLTAISYGQLYRWKRKGLIPEAWLIRKSTFTGQETFFPREKVLARIAQIRQLKEDASLDELAVLLSTSPVQLAMSGEALLARNIVSPTTLELFQRRAGDVPVLTFAQVLALYLVEELLRSGDASLDEGAMVLGLLLAHAPDGPESAGTLLLLRKLGVSTCCLVAGGAEVHFEQGTKVVAELALPQAIQGLKLILSEGA